MNLEDKKKEENKISIFPQYTAILSLLFSPIVGILMMYSNLKATHQTELAKKWLSGGLIFIVLSYVVLAYIQKFASVQLSNSVSLGITILFVLYVTQRHSTDVQPVQDAHKDDYKSASIWRIMALVAISLAGAVVVGLVVVGGLEMIA